MRGVRLEPLRVPRLVQLLLERVRPVGRRERHPAALVHLAQIRDDPLPRAAGRAIRFYKRPISVALPILLPVTAPHVHLALSYERRSPMERGLVFTTSVSDARMIRPDVRAAL